jgi:hypothetical protein
MTWAARNPLCQELLGNRPSMADPSVLSNKGRDESSYASYTNFQSIINYLQKKMVRCSEQKHMVIPGIGY